MKIPTTLPLASFRGSNPRDQSGLVGWFWLRVSHEDASTCQLGLHSSEVLITAEESTSKVAHLYGWQVGTGC